MIKDRGQYLGQALLIVLLSMAVVLVIVLSILARSITDVNISSQDENSLRAFSAAEAGIEKALIIGSSIGSTEIGDASYRVNVSSAAEGESEFNYPRSLFSGETATIWFVAHDEDNKYVCSEDKPCFIGRYANLCWAKTDVEFSESNLPALEVSIFYTEIPGNYSTLKIARESIDPNTTRILENNFFSPEEGACTILDTSYQFQKIIDFEGLGIPESVYSIQENLLFMKVRFLYNTDKTSHLGISVNYPGNTLLPAQGLIISSAGISGNANRKIEVFSSYEEIPEIFGYAIYTSGLISK